MVNAQIKVTGTVYSEQNRETLIGATIIIEGTETGTITDLDGKFSIVCRLCLLISKFLIWVWILKS